MPLQVKCRECKTECMLPDSFVGKQIACPWCGAGMFVAGTGEALEPIKSSPLSNLLDEELGTGPNASHEGVIASGGLVGNSMRRAHKLSRLWIQAALLLAITGGISSYIILLQLWPETAIPIGWLIFFAGLAVLFCRRMLADLRRALRRDNLCGPLNRPLSRISRLLRDDAMEQSVAAVCRCGWGRR